MVSDANTNLGRRGRDLEFPLDFDGKDSVYTLVKVKYDTMLRHRFSGSDCKMNIPFGVKIVIRLNQSELRAELDDGSGKPNV